MRAAPLMLEINSLLQSYLRTARLQNCTFSVLLNSCNTFHRDPKFSSSSRNVLSFRET
jgi:hypothetical protein